MKSIVTFTAFCSLSILSSGRPFAQGQTAKDVSWDAEKRSLSYTLPRDSIVKIRVGRESGPVYETLVNLEERKAGKHKEAWSGKDSKGLIDFIKFGDLHFCVDPLPKLEKDLELLVDLPSGVAKGKGVITVNQNFSLNIDIEKKDREKFAKTGFEVRTFIDGEFVKVDNGRDLPYRLKLNPVKLSPGEHLLSINAWPVPERSRVAYKNMLISYEYRKQAVSNTVRGKKFSPAIAFCQRVDGYWQINIADLDGSNSRRITTSSIDKSSPAFSPDGRLVAYVNSAGELWIFDRASSEERKIPLPINCAEARFAPDGKNLIFTSYQDLYHGDTELWTVDIEDYSLKKIVSRPWLQYNAVSSPDGNYIIFVDGPELYGQEIRKLNHKTKDITQLTDNGPYDFDMQPCFSPDGENIYYSSNQDGNYDIWAMDKFGQDPRNLTRNPADDKAPQVGQVGESIYFLSDRSGSVQIWRMGVDGGNPEQMTRARTDLRDLSLYEVK